MDEFMMSLMALGIVGSFLVAGSMAWYVTPPSTPDPMHRPPSERRR
jgi:hypothetical protein